MKQTYFSKKPQSVDDRSGNYYQKSGCQHVPRERCPTTGQNILFKRKIDV